MLPLAVFTAILTLTVSLYQFFAFNRLKKYILSELGSKRTLPQTARPKVSVIMPCKGMDQGFSENLKVLLNQDYFDNSNSPNYEVIFVLGSSSDDAFIHIKSALDNYPKTKTKLIIAPPQYKNVHKLNSQLTGLKACDKESQIIVFVDSDVVASANFLENLIAPLDDKSIGLTTGYRFYIPSSYNIPGLLRTVWNRVSAWEMADPKLVFAWGGAMACRTETISKINLFKLWENCADDDLSLTKAVKDLGLKVKFVPACLVASYADGSFAEIREWTNRQLLLLKYYYTELWLKAMANAIILFLITILQLFFAVFYLLTYNPVCLIPLMSAFFLLLSELLLFLSSHKFWYQILIKPWYENKFVSHKIDLDFYESFNKSLMQFYFILPLAHLILPIISLTSIFINTLKWRGLTYKINKPHDITVVST